MEGSFKWSRNAEILDEKGRVGHTDEYGRFHFFLPAGQTRILSIRAKEFKAQTVTAGCETDEVVERIIRLQRE
jgi:hypothetical protein